MFQEGSNNTTNTKRIADGQTWRKLKRIAFVVENLFTNSFSESIIFVICNSFSLFFLPEKKYICIQTFNILQKCYLKIKET